MNLTSLSALADFYQKRFGYEKPRLNTKLHPETKLIIVIPCYNEPDLLGTLSSLKDCDPPKFPVSVIVVINAGSNADQEVITQNERSEKEADQWIAENRTDKLSFHILHEKDLPSKHAGVGLARKIGMDEALYQFASIDYGGLIVCLDADCTVDKNYLQILEKEFLEKNPSSCSLYFEHELDKTEDIQLREGIIRYELILRYYVNALRYSGFPFAFHTIGSSMAVRADIYAKSGGMNRRKAGEDFYFLHKVAPYGDLLEINETIVYPSSRISDRVPFGTGKAQMNWINKATKEVLTYNALIFKDLKLFVSSINVITKIADLQDYLAWLETQPETIKAFLIQENFEEKLIEMQKNTSHPSAFQKRFYAWLDGFKVLKFVHFARDNFYSNQPIEEACRQLLQWQLNEDAPLNTEELLMRFRKMDKGQNTKIIKSEC